MDSVASNLRSENKNKPRVKSVSGLQRPTFGGIMDEKLYEVRRREEKSISFGLIKRPQRKGLLSVPLKGLSAYPYVGCAGQVDKWPSK